LSGEQLAGILLRIDERNSLKMIPMNAHIYGIQIRVLLCYDDGEWAARALELDLLGYGKTQDEAINNLKEAVESQITFAHQMNDAGLLPFPSEPEYFKRWEEAQTTAVRSRILGDTGVNLQVQAVFITLTGDNLKALRKQRRFTQAEPACA
jgi:hypothetical protein